ncbi:O-antigen ligase family protein [Paenibacillus sp. NPDC056722]|uniref:O-antigen ligase family protein n=1 Tax=Paenibacillus sp. NPDC056722 TaxID=3345924 RepID=UPI0036B1FB61
MMTIYETKKLPFYTLLLFIIAGMLGAGFFEPRSFLALAAVLYAVTAVYLAGVKKFTLLPVHIFLLIIMVLYWLAVGYAADPEQAVLEAVKVSLLLPVTLLFSGLSSFQRDRLWAAWSWGGAGLTLWGLFFGLFREGRLESTLGYANVYAVVMAAGLTAGWHAYRRSSQQRYWLLMAIQLCGLLMSGSRAVLILVAAGTAFLLFLNRRSKGAVWGAIIMLVVLLAAVVVGVLYGGTGSIRSIGWNATEFSLRRIYWSDGLRLWKTHWLTGTGGGGWAVLYPSVFVKYVHQQYLQMALDTGIAGALAFIAMILTALRAKWRRGREGLSIMLAVLLFCAHLAFDIDMAYPLVFGLFVMLLAEMELAGYKGKEIMLTGLRTTAVVLPCLIAICTFVWMTAGYMLISKGEAASARREWKSALQSLQSAEKMLPWSDKVHYQMATAYSGLAESQGDESTMKKAINEIRIAASKVPANKKYQEMLKKVEKSKK